MRARVYIDGFNLYNGALKNTPYKWLDVVALGRRLIPTHDVDLVRFFTAYVKPSPLDPHQRERQEVYLRAAATREGFSAHFGFFMRKTTKMPIRVPLPEGTPGTATHSNGSQSIQVVKTEEKGSDVNLASYLLLDAFFDDFDTAVVVSNDGDLAEPVQMVRDHFTKRVLVINPHRGKPPSGPLFAACDEHRDMHKDDLRACQLPLEVFERDGRRIHKPPTWS